MPVALERKLEREAKKKGIKDKDAYVYGTLRKTGWKPSREKKMSSDSKLVRLTEINGALDPIIGFNDDDKRGILGTAALLGGGTAAGVGGTLGHKAIINSGGYAANWQGAKTAFGLERKGVGAFMKVPGGGVAARSPATTGGLGYKVGSTIGNPTRAILNTPEVVGKGVSSALGKIFNPETLAKFRGAFMQSKGKILQLDNPNLLEPAQGSPEYNSKILQEHFPAGPNPDFAPWAANLSTEEMLKLPMPELVKYLNQRNILQQQYPAFSAKVARLIELNSRVDKVINFNYDDGYTSTNWAGPIAGVGVGAGALLGHRAIMNRGGYGQTWKRLTGGATQAAPSGPGPMAMNTATATAAAPQAAGAAANVVREVERPEALKSTMKRISARWAKSIGSRPLQASLAVLSSNHKLIRLSGINSQMSELLQFEFKPFKKKGDKEKNEKKPFKKGHKLHGGGT